MDRALSSQFVIPFFRITCSAIAIDCRYCTALTSLLLLPADGVRILP